MSDQDLLHRFVFDNCDFRGEIVTLGESYRQALHNHPYPRGVRQLLGECLTAAALLSSSLKFKGRISIQAKGEGPVSLLMAECNHHQDLRGIVRLRDGEKQTSGQGLGELVGQGVMAITIEPEKGERYQGLVPMESPSLAACLQAYFEQSEQLKTRLWFAVDDQACTGLMLQALPGSERASPEQNRAHLETLSTLAGTVTAEELLSLDHAPLLYRLFNEYPLRLFDPTALRFACHCSRERSAGALLSLGRDEVEQLLVEQGGIDIDCQFCNQHYHFNAADVRQLLGDTTLH